MKLRFARGFALLALAVLVHAVTPAMAAGPTCIVPGPTILTDPAGDTSAVLGITPTPAPPGSDLLSFQLAQPFAADGVIKLAFTINTNGEGQSPQPPGSAWYVAMQLPGNDPAPAPQLGFHYRAVRMFWGGPTPSFQSYTPSANTAGNADGRFVTAGSVKPAEASSSYAAPFNKVVIVVKASDLGLNPGDTMGFVSGVSQTTNAVGTGPAATALFDQMPDDLVYTGSFTVTTNAFCATASAPGAPTIGTATPGNGQASIAFNPPASDGGSPITSYTVTCNPGSITATGTASPITVTGLANGTTYTCSVTATNAQGTSAPSQTVSVTPAVVPGAPVIGTASPGDGQASIAFSPPGSNGGAAITSYTVTCNPGSISASGPTSPITVTGLTNGTAYDCSVTATNSVGTGPPSNTVSVIPSAADTVPGAPTIGTATPGDRQASIAFTPPGSDGGSAITSYTVTCSPGGTATGAASPITVTGLTNGTQYTCSVTATNAVGTSAPSATASVTPMAAESAIFRNGFEDP